MKPTVKVIPGSYDLDELSYAEISTALIDHCKTAHKAPTELRMRYTDYKEFLKRHPDPDILIIETTPTGKLTLFLQPSASLCKNQITFS